MPTELPKIKYRGKIYIVDFRLQELRNAKTAKRTRFVNMPEGKDSRIKKALRGLRFRTWHQEYIAGLDD